MVTTLAKRSLEFINEGIKIVALGTEKEITLRLMGAAAIRLHCSKYAYLYNSMPRPISDLDFMTHRQAIRSLQNLFSDLGCVPNRRVIAYYGNKRHIYYNEKKDITVDVFIDKLEMCHTIDFRNRLKADYPTISLADLLLEKTQIVKISEKDIKDIIILLRAHSLGETEKEIINLSYIRKLLSNDWGFYYTFKSNMNKTKEALKRFDVLPEDRKDITIKIDNIMSQVENEPKSFKWKIRAKVGTKKRWYQTVEDYHERIIVK